MLGCSGLQQQQQANEKAEGSWLSSLPLGFCSNDNSVGPARVPVKCLQRIYHSFKMYLLGNLSAGGVY